MPISTGPAYFNLKYLHKSECVYLLITREMAEDPFAVSEDFKALFEKQDVCSREAFEVASSSEPGWTGGRMCGKSPRDVKSGNPLWFVSVSLAMH